MTLPKNVQILVVPALVSLIHQEGFISVSSVLICWDLKSVNICAEAKSPRLGVVNSPRTASCLLKHAPPLLSSLSVKTN